MFFIVFSLNLFFQSPILEYEEYKDLKKVVFLLTFLLCGIAANAASFSLQVIQKNTPGDNVFDSSYVVEQAVLDYFFEKGMIVSNNPVIVSKNDEASDRTELHRAFIEARLGCMDLLVKLSLNFSVLDSANPTAVLLSNIRGADLEIVSLKNSETIIKGRFTPPAVNDMNNNRGGVETFATNIAIYIQAELAKKGGAV